MDPECVRVADQLIRAFSGEPWHGSPVSELLDGVTAEVALRRVLPSAHTVWELVLHIDVYVTAACAAAEGTPMPRLYETKLDWPAVENGGEAAWSAAKAALFRNAASLAHAIAGFTDSRLDETVPGREYSFYHLFHGVVQHTIYHAGQIALLRHAPVALLAN